jgi:hypothetical protein
MSKYQNAGNSPSLDQLYELLRQRESRGEYALAEPIMRQILEVPGQPPQQYLYLPAEFYEAWGDVETGSATAAYCYREALNCRYRIGSMATGSGEGAEAMLHANRVKRKLDRLTAVK